VVPQVVEGRIGIRHFAQIGNEFANANQEAAVFGWVGVVLATLLLALSLVGLWRLRRQTLGHARQFSA
jgi:hypothetical protein